MNTKEKNNGIIYSVTAEVKLQIFQKLPQHSFCNYQTLIVNKLFNLPPVKSYKVN